MLPQHPSGVITLWYYCCPLREREPLLRLAKSALVTVYPLLDGRFLIVVNIHAVNFSIGIDVYSKQLDPIGEQIKGPVIMAEDFNAWSKQRINALFGFAGNIHLEEMRFPADYPKRAFGRSLDCIFYRDLSVTHASVMENRASDHNPLRVDFLAGKPLVQ